LFNFNRQKVQDIIFNAEINSANIGTSVMDLFQKYATEFEAEDPAVSVKLIELSKKLQSGVKRWDAYAPYIDEDILSLLKVAEENSITADRIIRGYVPVKNITKKYQSSIRSNIIGPSIGALIISAILGYTVSQFKKPIDQGMVTVSQNIHFITNHYYLMSFSFVIVLSGFIIIFPNKVPILKGIFKKLESLMSLAIIRTMLQLGYSSDDLIGVIKKQYKIDFVVDSKGITGLIQLLRFAKYITPEEAAEIKITTQQDDPIKTIDKFIQDRVDAGESLIKEAGKAVTSLSMIMTAVPIILMVLVMISFLMAAADLSQGGH
jgi:hypothetical protein